MGGGGGSDLSCSFAFRYYLDSRMEGALLRAVLRSRRQSLWQKRTHIHEHSYGDLQAQNKLHSSPVLVTC